MAKVVGGFVLPHEPGIFRIPEEEWSHGQRRVHAAYATVRERIGDLGATSVVVVGADHYVLFGPGCLPSFLIGIGDVTGPYERFPGIDRGILPSNPLFANHIAMHGRMAGLDWAVAKTLQVDHSIGLPARICALPNPKVQSIIPVYLASGVQPLITMRRAYQVGQGLLASIESWPENERVVVIGSGGISHWVGMAQMGKTNEEFDRWVLDCVARGDAESLICLSDEQVLAQAGNGALEIRNYVCAMGAMPSKYGKIIAYENSPEWVAGLGFAEIGVPNEKNK